jgi:DNA-binding Lrp family transcriptional regulator
MKTLDSLIDETDKKIIELMEKNPYYTHLDIAKQLNRSQPAIGARIKKLAELGLLKIQMGTDFKSTSYFTLMQVDLITSKPEILDEMAAHCPYVINAFKTTGEYNVSLFIACSNLRRLDKIVDVHFRNKTFIRGVSSKLITGFAMPYVLPINFAVEDFENYDDKCRHCSEHCTAGVHNPIYDATLTSHEKHESISQ